MNRVIFFIVFLIILNFIFFRTGAQSGIPEETVSISFHKYTLENCLHEFSNITGLKFAYRHSLLDTIDNISIVFEDVRIKTALDSLLLSHNIDYIYKNGLILLRRRSEYIQLKGCIAGIADSAGIPYASLSLKGKTIGAICDFQGNYQWELSHEHKSDTLIISSMGYKRQHMLVKDLIKHNSGCLFLEERSFEIEPVTVSKKYFKVYELGNNGHKASGSLYLDTHGQQTGLCIENKHGTTGILKDISFFLDDDGNTYAPFRVRIYEIDSSRGIPAREIPCEIIIAKPNGTNDWFTIDLSDYCIDFPENGIFIALQGIFPNDYNNYSGSDEFIDIKNKTQDSLLKEAIPRSIAYGQKIGCNRRMSENTWHYSLSHIWFQLPKQQYGVLIKASVKFVKYKKKKGN